jgi:hypothetical protein
MTLVHRLEPPPRVQIRYGVAGPLLSHRVSVYVGTPAPRNMATDVDVQLSKPSTSPRSRAWGAPGSGAGSRASWPSSPCATVADIGSALTTPNRPPAVIMSGLHACATPASCPSQRSAGQTPRLPGTSPARACLDDVQLWVPERPDTRPCVADVRASCSLPPRLQERSRRPPWPMPQQPLAPMCSLACGSQRRRRHRRLRQGYLISPSIIPNDRLHPLRGHRRQGRTSRRRVRHHRAPCTSQNDHD